MEAVQPSSALPYELVNTISAESVSTSAGSGDSTAERANVQAQAHDECAPHQQLDDPGSPRDSAKGDSHSRKASIKSLADLAAKADLGAMSRLHVFLSLLCAPLLAPLLIAVLPLQDYRDGFFVNYTWWAHIAIDIIVYSFFMVGIIQLLLGEHPFAAGWRHFLNTGLVYGVPHIILFPILGYFKIWPVPFCVYLACGPIYLIAILFNFKVLIQPWFLKHNGDHQLGDTSKTGRWMVAQFFAQAVVVGLLVGYRALFAVQEETGQVIMAFAWYPLVGVSRFALGAMTVKSSAPEVHLAPIAAFAFDVLAGLFKAFLFPGIKSELIFGILLVLDGWQMLWALTATSDWYVQRRGKITSLQVEQLRSSSPSGLQLRSLSQASVDSTPSTPRMVSSKPSSPRRNTQDAESVDEVMAKEDKRILNELTNVLTVYTSKCAAMGYFVAIVLVTWSMNRENVFFFDGLSDSDIRRGLEYSAYSAACHFLYICMTVFILWRRGVSAYRLFMKTFNNSRSRWFYFLQVSVNMLLIMLVLVKHWGCDFNFHFGWL